MLDSYPHLIDVFLNGSSMLSDTWSSDVAITLPLDVLVTGVYNLTFIATDTSGNTVIRTVFLTVEYPFKYRYSTNLWISKFV
jgi:hypothetical protein